MERDDVLRHEGQRVLIRTKQGYNFKGVIPHFEGTSFSFTDKFGETVSISCDFIDIILPIREEDYG